MNLKDELNQMVIGEVIQGMLAHIEDKEMIKEKGAELLGHLDKIPDEMVLLVTKLNGRVFLALDNQKNIKGFVKDPDFIDIQSIVEKAIDSF